MEYILELSILLLLCFILAAILREWINTGIKGPSGRILFYLAAGITALAFYADYVLPQRFLWNIMLLILCGISAATLFSGRSGASRGEKAAIFMIAAVFMLYLAELLKTAWICDDAYITYRVADNFLNGYGLRWNVEERVQAYTNPLMLFVIIPVYWAIKNVYITGLAVSGGFAIAAFILLIKNSRSAHSAALAALILASSKSFIDFSTSGLENSLSCLLAVIFFSYYRAGDERSVKRIFVLSMLAALSAVNRLDTLLIYVIPLAYAVKRAGISRSIPAAAAGMAPLAAWLIFAVVYYGFPFPNTFHAKTNTHLPATEILQEGAEYFFMSYVADPAAGTALLGALLLPVFFFKSLFRQRDRFFLVISASMAAYMTYILCVGGDFMTGRFLVLPIFLSAISVSVIQIADRKKTWAALSLSVLFLGFYPASHTRAGLNATDYSLDYVRHRFVNEREFYHDETSLLNAIKRGSADMSGTTYAKKGIEIRRQIRDGRAVAMEAMIGYAGFYAGPQVHIIDRIALSDPFLARLPTEKRGWKIGHFYRVIPEGYIESVQKKENLIKDPELAEYYGKVLLITQGPIFAKERLKAIVEINTGKYDRMLAELNED